MWQKESKELKTWIHLAPKDNKLKKVREKLYWRKRCEKNALVFITSEDLQTDRLQEFHD